MEQMYMTLLVAHVDSNKLPNHSNRLPDESKQLHLKKIKYEHTSLENPHTYALHPIVPDNVCILHKIL
jgi:hypothetical protein